MALITRLVTNAGAPLSAPDGALLANTKIIFVLVNKVGAPADAWDAATSERVGGESITVTTDAKGEFSVALWPNSRGDRVTRYHCAVQHPGFREFFGVVEDVPGTLTWSAFMLSGGEMTAQDMSAIAAAIAGHVATVDPHTQYTTTAEAAAAAPVQSVAAKTGAVTLVKADVGLGNVDDTSDANKPVSTAQQAALDAKAPIASPTFTGTVSGITKAMVGLGNVDDTSDANKPVSTAAQDALNLKANLASPALTGTPTAPTAAVGTNTTQLATTAFVTAERSNTATLTNKTINFASNTLTGVAPLASPALTGTPTAPTAAVGTDTTQLATTAFAVAQIASQTSLTAAPGKIPLASASGRLDPSWYAALLPNVAINHIGFPGTAGFGVGICPTLPAGYTPLPGCTDPLSANYGNYQYSDGSVMCWIPAFYFRLDHAGNPTYGAYGANSIDVKPTSAFPDEATANASSYYLHRAFINADAVQQGFFRDKYDCSNNGGTASSIALAMPLVSGPATGQVGFNSLTGAPANAYYGAIPAAQTRGAKFFPESVFIADALCRLTEAHAQAATSSTYCAWYDDTGAKNFPKGNNNNALKDGDDLTVTFTSAGASGAPNMALTGSGSNFAKTTHNGQACGIADVNGNIYKINLGMTCIATGIAITGATQANPVVLTVVGHGRATGDVAMVTSVGGMTQINNRLYTVTVIDVDRLSLDGVDGTGFAAYTSGGTLTTGAFYALKSSVDIAAVTSGASSATDHWGATGVAAQFDAVPMNFATTYPSNAFAQRYGNEGNAVFSMATAADRARSMLGMPAAGGMSTAGSNLMGLDYYYQRITDQLCVMSRGIWSHGSIAGSRFRDLSNARASAYTAVGFAACSYLG